MAFSVSKLGSFQDIFIIILVLFSIITCSVGLYDRDKITKDSVSKVDPNHSLRIFMVITLISNVLFLTFKLVKIGLSIYTDGIM